ncbi:MAG: hypothetical protein SFV20_06925 [Sphingopyxis sp.]|nr:hypothetical protein [Sphingopyxis sp.]
MSFIGWGLWKSAEYEWEADNQTSKYAAYTDKQIRQSCPRRPSVDQQNCAAKARHEQRANERNERDLVAQKKSALWAYIMGAAAVIGMGLSTVGVILVWTTFRETKSSNDLFRHNQRARLIVKCELDATMLNGDITMIIKAENVGQSIAIDAVCRADAHADVPDHPFTTNEQGFPHNIPAGKDAKMTVITGLRVGSVMAGQIEYRTIFGGPEFSYFCFRVTVTPNRNLGGLPCKPNHWPEDT